MHNINISATRNTIRLLRFFLLFCLRISCFFLASLRSSLCPISLSPLRSICVFIYKPLKKCHDQYLKVQSQRPVLYIIQITVNSLANGCISPVPIHLCPSGQSRTNLVFYHISRYLFFELLYKLCPLRSWSNQTHLP